MEAAHEDVSRRYRDLVRMYHPDLARDKADATEKLILINQAYSVLRDTEKRIEYDEARRRLLGHIQTGKPVVVYSPGVKKPTAPPHRAAATQPCAPDAKRPASNQAVTCCERHRPMNSSQGGGDINCAQTCALNRAQSEFDRGKYACAGDFCQRHLAAVPDSRRALELLGDVYAHEFNVERAITTYLAALHLAPRETRLRAKIQCLKASVQIQEEEESLARATQFARVAAEPAVKPGKERSFLSEVIATLKSKFR